MLDPLMPRMTEMRVAPYAPPEIDAPASEHRAYSEVMQKAFSRSCGPCTACCTTHGVIDAELPMVKPGHVACQHLCALGCKVYHRRPKNCAGFECGWKLDSRIPRDMRPDASGWVFDVMMKGPPPVLAHDAVDVDMILFWRAVAVVPLMPPSDRVREICRMLADQDGGCVLMLGKQTVGNFVELYVHERKEPLRLEIVGPCSGAITWMDKDHADHMRGDVGPPEIRCVQISFAALKLVVDVETAKSMIKLMNVMQQKTGKSQIDVVRTLLRLAREDAKAEAKLLIASWRLEYPEEFVDLPESLFAF